MFARSREWWGMRTLMVLVLVTCIADTASAQNGAVILLQSFGARAVGQGEAVVADSTLGTEAMWWNPAALARIGKKEIAVHHSQTIVSTNDMITTAIPSRVLGTVAFSAYLVNYGDQAQTDNVTGAEIGTITIRDYLLAMSYATAVGKRFSAGVTYKFVMPRYQCTGLCGPAPVFSGSTSALDLGALYVLPTSLPISVGASVRNLGPSLQVRDAEQADPLPRLVQVGGKARLPIQSLRNAGASLDVTLDMIFAPALNGTAGGTGIVLGYRDKLFMRGGYKVQPGALRGPSIGFSADLQSFTLDLARRFDAVNVGEPPTYISLRARF